MTLQSLRVNNEHRELTKIFRLIFEFDRAVFGIRIVSLRFISLVQCM